MTRKKEQERLLALYRVMYLIRTVETALTRLFSDSEIPGFIHLSIGQEAIAAGVMAELGPQDSIATTHRGHGHVLARGIDLDLFFKELMGKNGGICRGRGGSMHVADMDLGILGANGIVGAGIPIALGSALAHQVRRNGGVAIAFFGDGAMAEGVMHESLNLASLWRLPMLFACENNGWSEFSPTSEQFTAELGRLAAAFGVPHVIVDGNDVEAVAKAAQQVVQEARSSGPRVLECRTFRVRGHFEGDPQKYRPTDHSVVAAEIDPITRAEQRLAALNVEPGVIEEIKADCDGRVAAAIERARADALPDFDDAMADVYTVNATEGARKYG